jgi:hypothetical protein
LTTPGQGARRRWDHLLEQMADYLREWFAKCPRVSTQGKYQFFERESPLPTSSPGGNIHLTAVECNCQSRSGKPLPIQPGEHVTCRLTLGTDPAAISGYVTEEGKSVKNMAVLLAPSSAVQREAHPYAGIGQIDGKGHYVIRGVAPGEYLLLIAPDDRTGSYLAPGFVRKHQFEARPIHVGPNQDLTVNLTLPTK